MLAQLRAGWARRRPAHRRARLPRPGPAATTWLAWLLPVFAWAPLTYPGYFQFLNGYSPIFNLDDFLRSHAPLSWAPTIGQGYDLLAGEGRLPYILAALPRQLGLDGAAAIKLVMAAAIVAGAVGMYGWSQRRLGPWPALVAAAVYAFWPLGLSTVYVAGAFAETVLLGLLPYVWWAVDACLASGGARQRRTFQRRAGPYRPLCRPRPPVPRAATVPKGGNKGRPYAYRPQPDTFPRQRGAWHFALGLALVAAFWTHAGLALWLAASVLAYLLAHKSGRRLVPLAAWFGGLGVGLIGLLPVALAHGTASRPYVIFADQYLNPYQLLQPGWSLDADLPPVSLGLAGIGLALIGVLLFRDRSSRQTFEISETSKIPSEDQPQTFELSETSKASIGEFHAARSEDSGGNRRMETTVWFACACVVIPVLCSLGLSAPIWRLPLLAGTLTYPWQLLLLAGPWLAWLAGLGALALLSMLYASSPVITPVGEEESGAASRISGLAARDTLQSPIPLAAGLIAIALLSVYGDLNPPPAPALAPDRPVAVFGDNQIALVSAVISDTMPAGDRASVRVQWQALRPLDQDYTVFFHAEAPDGKVYGQQDTMPRAGKAPTSSWRPGAVISDTYTLRLNPDAPLGVPYHYVLGLYQWQTGERLGAGSQDRVVLDDK